MASQLLFSEFVKAPAMVLLVESGLVAVALDFTLRRDAFPLFSFEGAPIELKELRENVVADIAVLDLTGR